MHPADSTSAPTTPPQAEAIVLGLVEATLRELHADAPGLPPVLAGSRLDRDLGFDSLARTELLLRIEREFGVTLPEDTLQHADTVADLVGALQRVAPGTPASVRAPIGRSPAILAVPGGGPAGADLGRAQTLLEVLDGHVHAHPDRTQVICLVDEVEPRLSYRQLADDAAAIAGALQRAGVQPRQTVALMLPTSPEYFGTYFGVLRAGAIPVPIYPPARASQLEEHVIRHSGILANAQATMLVTVPEALLVARLLQARVPGLRQVTTSRQLAAQQAAPAAVAVRADDIAFIQYTSGSTGNPKGVALTHANLLANIQAMATVVEATSDDVFVSWLPLYHDMGLIGAWLAALVVGFPTVVMSPLAFLARPLRWLEAITRYRGTLSAAPNFAYELCLKRIGDAELAALDLGSWRLAMNGAEAVRPDTVRRFGQRFAPCGLRAEAVAPVYGLAESCVGLLLPPRARVPPIDSIQRGPFTRDHRALPAAADDPQALQFVGVGRPLPGHAIRIVGDDGREVADRIEGRLEFRGPSATHGYYRNPRQTDLLIHDGWLDSGDRAYRAEGEVYVTGRVKDIVIRGGRNLYPEEIEAAVGAVDGVRKGCVAVFGSPDPGSGTEGLVVLAEARHGDAAAHARLRAAITDAVVAAIGEPPDRIELAPPHAVLKTSSGKIRRSACRARFESGRIATAAPSAWQQALRLALGALGPRLRSLAASAGTVLYAAHALLVFGLLAPLTWGLTALTASAATAWRIGHAASRALLALTATPLRVRGLERLPAGPCVLVSNHGSYLDGVILVAALPRPFVFVAKSELGRHFVSRVYFNRLGAVFVERFDAARGVAAAEGLVGDVARGRSLAVFPEGTFVAEPGLLPFHLGAFLVAARTRVPVVPLTLRGSRELLRDGRWWPRRAALAVEIHPPLVDSAEAGDVFAAAVRLRDAARRAIGGEAQ